MEMDGVVESFAVMHYIVALCKLFCKSIPVSRFFRKFYTFCSNYAIYLTPYTHPFITGWRHYAMNAFNEGVEKDIIRDYTIAYK